MRKKQCACEVCGVTSEQKEIIFHKKSNMFLCGKHHAQMKNRGFIMDTSPYGIRDLNRYRIDGDTVCMEITDNHENVICEAKYDLCFLKQVSGRKWRRTEKNQAYYVATRAKPPEKAKHTTLHRYVATLAGWDIDGYEIDHINGDTMDNRLCNLRRVTRIEQLGNLAPKKENKLGIRGVSFDKRDNLYIVDFAYNNHRYYFHRFDDLSEAVYVRYLMEDYFHGDVVTSRHMSYMKPHLDKLTDLQKETLKEYVYSKITEERGCDLAQVC